MTFEQVATAVNAVAWRLWNRLAHDLTILRDILAYHQRRNQASYDSRKRRFEKDTL